MTVDLTQAVEDTARATFNAQYPDAAIDWDRLPAMNKHMAREAVLPIVTAAAPAIEKDVKIDTLLWASSALRETGEALKREGSPDAAGYLDASTFLRAEAALSEIHEGMGME